MKRVLLFLVTIMLFMLYLLPFIAPFGEGSKFSNDAIGASYTAWYIMLFILTLCWGHVIYYKGCWFFDE